MAKQSKTNKPNNKEEQPLQQQEQQASVPSATTNNPLIQFIKGKENYLLLAVIAISCFIIFYDFITAEKVYLYKDIGSDSVNAYWPWVTHLSDYLKHEGTPAWSFSQGLGQNVFPLWLGDFFSNIIMLFSKERIPYLIAFAEIIKVFLCGFVFFKYLIELKLSRFTAYLGAFLFAFCGYIMVGGCWVIFSAEALYAAIILYGFERWLNKGKILWFVLGIAALSFLQPFLLFPHALFLAIYTPVRYNDVYGSEWKKFPLFIAKTIGLGVIAVAISAYQLFPDLLQYIESPRVGGEAGMAAGLKAKPMFSLADPDLRFATTFRAFGSNMLGTGVEYKGWYNYLEAPLFYCGIFCLVVFTQIFTALNKGQKIAYGMLAGLFLLPVIFPYFRYIFWAFTGDYFRTFSLVITILLLLFSVKALDHILKTGKINLIVLGATVAFLLFLLYTPSADFAENISQGLRSTTTLLIFVYAAVLWGLTRAPHIKNISIVLLALLCFFEMTFNSSTTVNDRDAITAKELTEKTGYNDYTVDAINFIKVHDKGFYRVNKEYISGPAIHASFNDGKMQGYYGTTSYFSFNQKNYIKFLSDLGVLDPTNELQTRWITGLIERPLLMSLTSGKYIVSKKPTTQYKALSYDSIGRFNDVYLYKNNYSIPFGVAYSQVIDEASFKKLSTGPRDIFILKGCVVGAEDNDLLAGFSKLNLADTLIAGSLDYYFKTANDLRNDSMVITQFKESHIKGEITETAPRILFFSIPFDEGWKATINGKETKLYRVNCGLTGLKLPVGKSSIDLQFEPRYKNKGALVSIIALLALGGLLAIRMRKQPQTIEN